MTKERKPGWVYVYSDTFKQEYAFHKESGWVYFSDGVKYSPEELKIICEGGKTLTPAIHNVKLLFGGEVIKNEGRAGTNDKGKPTKSGGVKDTDCYSHNAGKVQDSTGYSPDVECGKLDIY